MYMRYGVCLSDSLHWVWSSPSPFITANACFLPFYGWAVSHCIHVAHLYPFILWWTFRLFHVLANMNSAAMKIRVYLSFWIIGMCVLKFCLHSIFTELRKPEAYMASIPSSVSLAPAWPTVTDTILPEGCHLYTSGLLLRVQVVEPEACQPSLLCRFLLPTLSPPPVWTQGTSGLKRTLRAIQSNSPSF